MSATTLSFRLKYGRIKLYLILLCHSLSISKPKILKGPFLQGINFLAVSTITSYSSFVKSSFLPTLNQSP